MKNKITIIQAVFMIMRGLELPDSGNHYHKYYQALLEEIKRGRISVMKNEGRDWVDEQAINVFIQELIIKRKQKKAEENRAFYIDEDGQFQINDTFFSTEIFSTEAEKAIVTIQSLIAFYKNKECTSEQAIHEIAKIVGYQ
ncbi:hypothetical protein QYG89_15275 [Bacillus sp. B190/17]|uniref:Uncharacterized protein n=1 Tax=Bacillus lumedeiriae TaxID=3058829 RepID=A0ABW8IBY7_9BACI